MKFVQVIFQIPGLYISFAASEAKVQKLCEIVTTIADSSAREFVENSKLETTEDSKCE